jgi:hypothetical protein
LIQANREAMINPDAPKTLALQSDSNGASKDYFAWSVLGPLMRDGKAVPSERKKRLAAVRYNLPMNPYSPPKARLGEIEGASLAASPPLAKAFLLLLAAGEPALAAALLGIW